MNSHDLTVLVPWIIAHGYLIFLIVATIEGPLTTVAAGVAAALGYFNIYIIILLAIAGDFGGDIIYYGIGYLSHHLTRSPFFRYFGLTERRVERIEKLLHTHTRRAVLVVKFSPLIGPIGLIIIGAARPPFKKFFQTAVSVAIPKSIFFALVGYYSGQAYLQLNKVIAHGQYIILVLVALIGLVYLAYAKIMGWVTKRLEE
jgi:membrane protein DedA with SNARE-associated domain